MLLVAAGAGASYPLVNAHPRRQGAARTPARADAGSAADASIAAPRERPERERHDRARPLPRTAPSPSQEQPCETLTRGDRDGRWVHRDDVLPAVGFVDGDDLLTIVNRSPRFVLSPEYAPRDLVEVETGAAGTAEACVPPHRQCMRREAAEALRRMLDAMERAGHPGRVHSAFRSFTRQCSVFREWARGRGRGFCHAATSSAIAGHSQHQLGTAVDLVTEAWARAGDATRAGFGCTPGGRWIDEHAWEFGYVLPYPLPLDERAPGSTCRRRDGNEDVVDPRTGYRYEPWHLRYVGVDAAGRFHRAWLASGPGTATEVTLEQWLRRERGVDGDVDLPVCDGCSCGLCTTFHDGAPAASPQGARERPRPTGPCGEHALLVGGVGEPARAEAQPRIDDARAHREGMAVRVTVTVSVPAHTVTQTPVTSRYAGVYGPDATYRAVPPAARHATIPRAYPDLRGAWRLALAPRSGEPWPWRAALRGTSTPSWVNGANLRLPAIEGVTTVEVVVPPVGEVVRVALLRDGRVEGAVREVPIR